MGKIPTYTALTAPNNNDLLVIEDSVASSTKKITRENFLKGTALPADTVTTAAITSGAVTTEKTTAVSFSGAMSTGTITTAGFTGATISIPATTSPHKYQVVAVFVINHGGTASIRDYKGKIKLNGVTQKECQWSSLNGVFVNTISCTDIVTSSGDDITLTVERNTDNGGTLLATSNYSVVDIGL